jgi:hypothetical protein
MSLFTARSQVRGLKDAGRDALERAELDAINFRNFVIEDALAEPLVQSVENVGSSNSETVRQLQREAAVKLSFMESAIIQEGKLAKFAYFQQAAAVQAQAIASTIDSAFQALSLAGTLVAGGAAADTLSGLEGAAFEPGGIAALEVGPLVGPPGPQIPITAIPTPQIETDFNPDLTISSRLGPGG